MATDTLTDGWPSICPGQGTILDLMNMWVSGTFSRMAIHFFNKLGAKAIITRETLLKL